MDQTANRVIKLMPSIYGALLGHRENEAALADNLIRRAQVAASLDASRTDWSQAEYWSRRAARHGFCEDAYRLACVLMIRTGVEGILNGTPPPIDPLVECVQILDRCADAGNDLALTTLQTLSQTMDARDWATLLRSRSFL